MANTVRRPRSCEVCAEHYRPTYHEQRTCGRICGSKINARTLRAGPKCSVVKWRQCVHCEAWYTTRGMKRCGCAAYQPTSGLRTLQCKDCLSPFTYLVVTRLPDYCATCRDKRLAETKRDRRKARKVKQRGAQTEPVNARRVYERDQWRCGLCRRKVNQALRYPHPKSPSLDHVVPLAVGGEHSMANTQLAHLDCNRDKRAGGWQQLALVG
jgi:5-methylcytosine-specific restriction endonuclease McrA